MGPQLETIQVLTPGFLLFGTSTWDSRLASPCLAWTAAPARHFAKASPPSRVRASRRVHSRTNKHANRFALSPSLPAAPNLPHFTVFDSAPQQPWINYILRHNLRLTAYIPNRKSHFTIRLAHKIRFILARSQIMLKLGLKQWLALSE